MAVLFVIGLGALFINPVVGLVIMGVALFIKTGT